MGATSSKLKINDNKEEPSLKNKLDIIASQLILDTNNDDLLKLLEVTYCNTILKETENMLDNNYTKTQLDVINGIITNKPSTINIYSKLNTDDIEKSLKLIETTHITKKSLCKNIALFYTKITHLYAAIYRVIGEKSICAIKKKIHTVKTKKNRFTKNNLVFASSKYCKKNQIYKTKFLYDEIGIPELEELYKDVYDEEKKVFIMSEKQKKRYQNDVNTFYKAYTGTNNDGSITSFKDIPIFNYKISSNCDNSKHKNSNKTYVGFSNNQSLKDFANYLANIMNSANNTQIKLVNILENVIFKKINNQYIINDTLTMEILNENINIVRDLIVKMFIDCEENYQTAVNLFKSIVFDKNISISERRIKSVSSNNNLIENQDDIDDFNEFNKENEKNE